MKKGLLGLAIGSFLALAVNDVNAQGRFIVMGPNTIKGEKNFERTNDGNTANTNNWGRAIDSQWVNIEVVLAGPDSLACTPLAGGYAGKFVMVYRGTCNFSEKAYAAQQGGAIAVIIVNNVPFQGPVGMAAGNNATLVNVPVINISYEDGQAISAELANGPVFATLTDWGMGFSDDIGFLGKQASGHAFAVPLNQFKSGANVPQYELFNASLLANFGSQSANSFSITQTIEFTPTGGTSSMLNTSTFTPSLSNPLDPQYYLKTADNNNRYMPVPTTTGKYSLSYELIYPGDEYLDDNYNTTEFYITDSLFSKGRYDFTTNRPVYTAAYRHNQMANDYMLWGPSYYIGEIGHRAYKAQYYYAVEAIGGSQVGILDRDPSHTTDIFVMRWDDANQDGEMTGDELVVAATGTKVYGSTDSSNYYTIDLFSPDGNGPAILNEVGNYWVAVTVGSDYFLGADEGFNHYARLRGQYIAGVNDFTSYLYNGLKDDLVAGDIADMFPYARVQHIDSFGYDNTPSAPAAVPLHISKEVYQPGIGINDVTPVFNSVSLSPNPASTHIDINVDLINSADRVIINIYNVTGRHEIKKVIDGNIKTLNERIDVSGLASGHYVISINANNRISSQIINIVK